MKPTPQTILASPGVRGDCFRACIASILELPIEDVPHFVAIEHDWWGETQRWLAKRGLFAMWLPIRHPDEMHFCNPCEDSYCILAGASPRGNGIKHAVVGKIVQGWNFEIAYDPHPSQAGLDGPPTSFMIFVPLKPETAVAA